VEVRSSWVEVFDVGTLHLLESERCTGSFAWLHQAQAITAHPRFRDARLSLRKGVGANTKWPTPSSTRPSRRRDLR
jgi:hypothetical protein